MPGIEDLNMKGSGLLGGDVGDRVLPRGVFEKHCYPSYIVFTAFATEDCVRVRRYSETLVEMPT